MEYENVSWIGKIRGAITATKKKIKDSVDSDGVNEAAKKVLGAAKIFGAMVPYQQGASQNLGQPKVW